MVDGCGAMRAVLPREQKAVGLVTVPLPAAGSTTVYTRVGELFAILCTLGSVALLVYAWRAKSSGA